VVAFAEAHFELELPPRGGGKGRLRDHLRKVHEQTGHLDPRLAEESRLPGSLAHLMDWYLDLRASHAPGPGGPSALTYAELDAWARLTRQEPTPWEIETLRAIDVAFFGVAKRRGLI